MNKKLWLIFTIPIHLLTIFPSKLMIKIAKNNNFATIICYRSKGGLSIMELSFFLNKKLQFIICHIKGRERGEGGGDFILKED